MAQNERHEADAALANGEAFKALYEHAAIGVALFSIGGRFQRANPALCRLLGYSEEELLQKTHLDIVHLDDLEATAVARAQVISGKAKPRLTERRYVHKDGSAIWAQASGIVVRDAAGAPPCTVLFVVDVTGLKTALRASKRRFRRLIEMGSDWYWVQDAEDIDDLRKAFEDPADYRSRIWRHRKKNGDAIPVKITSFNLDFDGRRAARGDRGPHRAHAGRGARPAKRAPLPRAARRAAAQRGAEPASAKIAAGIRAYRCCGNAH
jgi:PAS domain S-box-containing protein